MGDNGNTGSLPRILVNRIWARLLGRGLVHPLDQMHSQNPASHPELLEELAEAVVESGYDVRHLTQAIVLSKVYARGASDSAESDRRLPLIFLQ